MYKGTPRSGDALALGSPTAGRMSNRARRAAEKRIFGDLLEIDWRGLPPPQPSKKERLLQQAKELRALAAGGMKPRAYLKKAMELEEQAAIEE